MYHCVEQWNNMKQVQEQRHSHCSFISMEEINRVWRWNILKCDAAVSYTTKPLCLVLLPLPRSKSAKCAFTHFNSTADSYSGGFKGACWKSIYI